MTKRIMDSRRPGGEADGTAASSSPVAGGVNAEVPDRASVEAAVKGFADLDGEMILRELAGKSPAFRELATQLYISAVLGSMREAQQPLTPAAAEALFDLGRRMSPDGLVKVLVPSLANRATSMPWDPVWFCFYRAIPEDRREEAAASIRNRLRGTGAPLVQALDWLELLHEVPEVSGTPLAPAVVRAGTARVEAASVLLRHGDFCTMGIVVSRDNRQVTVLAFPPPAPAGRSAPAGSWEVCVTEADQPQWVRAICSVSAQPGEKPSRAPLCLLRFPPVGRLALALPAPIVPASTEPTFTLVLPEESAGNRQAPPPRPGGWWLSPDPPDESRTAARIARNGIRFLPDGQIVGFWGNWTYVDMAGMEEAMAPQIIPGTIECKDADNQLASFEVFDPRRVLTRLVARVGLPVPEHELRLFAVRQGDQAAKWRIGEAFETEPEVDGAVCIVRLSQDMSDGSPFGVQIRGERRDGADIHSLPAFVYPVFAAATGRERWLGSESRHLLAEARDKGVPLPLDCTVQGAAQRYGSIQVQELCLQPEALLLDAAGAHAYVADRAGIRRIRLADFRETVGFLLPRNQGILAGCSEGLLVPALGADQKPCLQVLDRETLEPRLSPGLSRAPATVLGDWATPLAFVLDHEELTILHLANRQVVQRTPVGKLVPVPQRGQAAARRPVPLAQLDAGRGLLYLLADGMLHRFPVRADGTVNPAEGKSLRLPVTATPDRFTLRSDGEYALAGAVYDLRRSEPAPVFQLPCVMLAMSGASGDMLGFGLANPGASGFVLFDRHGLPYANWPSLHGCPAGAVAHPDGRHYLLWWKERAAWIEILTGENEEPER